MPGKNIVVERIPGEHIENHRVELVERKGLGHPDSLADGISESVSRALCRAYREEFGTIAHHNTDEVQIIGGKSAPAFGGGKVLKPIYILLGGRATKSYDGSSIDVHSLATEAAKDYLDSTVRNLDVENHVEIESRIGEGSPDLTSIYARSGQVPLSNDTSFGIGHAPLSETEKLVLTLEKRLNSEEMKEEMPFLGEDIKIMANRDNDHVQLTVAVAFVDRFVEDLKDYEEKKEGIKEKVRELAERHTSRELEVHVNTADGDDDDSIYLTVTGTSAEMGDDGSTGRGNRVSGLITPKRAMSLEATSGKNPVAHIGKIYNILSHYIADQVVNENPNIVEAHVKILSQIGRPINEPQIASVQVATRNGLTDEDREEIETETDYWLDNASKIMDRVIDGDITTF